MINVYTITHGVEREDGHVHWESLNNVAFNSYREATAYIMDELELLPVPVEFLGEYKLKFEFKDEWKDVHYAYINTHSISKAFKGVLDAPFD